jgi:hypothetical protein
VVVALAGAEVDAQAALRFLAQVVELADGFFK